jgi:PleD family two-component response regulator
LEKPKILIVEDDLDLSEMLNAYFRVQNYEVMTAAWGKDAIQITTDHVVDLIVLDIRLPDIDGYEVCRQLRTQRRTQDVPIIFLTEKRDRVDKLQGLELGVVDYITKPFDIQELRLRVRNALSRAARLSTTNPVSDLPENELVDEKLNGLILSDKEWALVLMAIGGLNDFREQYGFVAADDVLRAVTLMIRNAVREHGNEDDFIGHLGPEDFIVVTTPEKVSEIRQRIENRVRQSREYFYPLKDRDRAKEAAEAKQLRLRSGLLEKSAGTYENVDAIKTALYDGSVVD